MLVTSDEASSDGSDVADAELLADADGVLLARALARALFDAFAFALAFGVPSPAAPDLLVGLLAAVWSGAFVDCDPASACLVLFFVGVFGVAFLVGDLVGAFVAGAELRFTGAAPGGSLLPPFCQENARKPPFGTLVPPTPEDE